MLMGVVLGNYRNVKATRESESRGSTYLAFLSSVGCYNGQRGSLMPTIALEWQRAGISEGLLHVGHETKKVWSHAVWCGKSHKGPWFSEADKGAQRYKRWQNQRRCELSELICVELGFSAAVEAQRTALVGSVKMRSVATGSLRIKNDYGKSYLMPHSPKARILCSLHRIMDHPQVEGRQFGESWGNLAVVGWLNWNI